MGEINYNYAPLIAQLKNAVQAPDIKTIRQLSFKLEISEDVLAKIIRGEIDPSKKMFLKIVHKLGLESFSDAVIMEEEIK